MSSVLLSITGAVAEITLNRPEKYNAFTREMSLLLQEKLEECADENIRSVIITGTGKAFSAGQDLQEVLDNEDSKLGNILSEQLNPIIIKIRNLQKPVMAAVNGIAAGAGANIALACDIVVASKSAGFIQAFSKIGLIPDSGGTYFLPRLIGLQKASAIMMLGDNITAEEAERIGMIYKVFPDDNFKEESLKMAGHLASLPTKALFLTKRALLDSSENTLIQQLNLEDQLQATAAETEDFEEGVKAFIEKRKPAYKGK